MSIYEKLIKRLPSLYRPQTNSSGIGISFLQAVAQEIEALDRSINEVLLSHWYGSADQAMFSEYFNLDRKVLDLPGIDLKSLADQNLLKKFPYLLDLARIGGLLALPAWREPAALKESVETYRHRLKQYIMLYRAGLGTLDAIRTITDAELPPDYTLKAGRQQRPFFVEEFVPWTAKILSVPTHGDPSGIVGPLMRWGMENNGIKPGHPVLYIQGQTPIAGTIDPAVNPLVENYRPDHIYPHGKGIGYKGALAPDQTIRLRSAYISWLGTAQGVADYTSYPDDNITADPTASKGPWLIPENSPTGKTTAILQSGDNILWLALEIENEGSATEYQLWRHNGKLWQQVLETETLAGINILFEDHEYMLIGTDNGLFRFFLYPGESEEYQLTPYISALNGIKIFTIYPVKDDGLWLGTDNGTACLMNDGSLASGSLSSSPLAGMKVCAIYQDDSGIIYLGGQKGLFQYQPGLDHWYVYCGESESDNIPDWNIFTPASLPADKDIFLPPVTCIKKSKDAALWIGTEQGLVRYIARPVTDAAYATINAPIGHVAYKTVLEAYPDLLQGKVNEIREDSSGQIWFCTERGLFKYDCLNMHQYDFTENRWDILGYANRIYTSDTTSKLRGIWRFQNVESDPETGIITPVQAWQYFDSGTGWTTYSGAPDSKEMQEITCLLWTDFVKADLGSYDSNQFTFAADVDPDSLCMRIKPRADYIIEGGIPAIPCIPVGASLWRYLALEPENMDEPAEKPAWTIEGRFCPEVTAVENSPSPYPGRYNIDQPEIPAGYRFEDVFAFNPAVKIWFTWQLQEYNTAIIRLQKRSKDETIDPAIIDRVQQGVQRVRPAGLKVAIAVEQCILRGGENESG